jgi:hypothetical protein
MQDFNLKKFLVENRLTTNSRTPDESTNILNERKGEVERTIENNTPNAIGIELGVDLEIGLILDNPVKPASPLKNGVACKPAVDEDDNYEEAYIYIEGPERVADITNIITNYEEGDFDSALEIIGELILDYYEEGDPNSDIKYFVGDR